MPFPTPFFKGRLVSNPSVHKTNQPPSEWGADLFGEPGGIRTHDLLIRSQTLYPAELRAHMLFDSSDILAQAGGHVKCFFDMMPAHIVYYLKHLTMMDQEFQEWLL